MTYWYRDKRQIKSTEKNGFVGILMRRLHLSERQVRNLLGIAESGGKRELFVPVELGVKLRKKLEKSLARTREFLRESRNLQHEQGTRDKNAAKKQPFSTAELATIKHSLTVQTSPIVDSALRFMRESAGDGIAVTETGLQATGEQITPESLSGTLTRFCAAKNGVDQSSSLFAWAIGDACNLAADLGYYKADMYPRISAVTRIATNHLKKMAHFSKIIPQTVRIPGWPQSRYQQIVPLIKKARAQELSKAMSLIAEGDSAGRPLTLSEVRSVLSKAKQKPKPKTEARYLFITPSGLWYGNRFLRSVALNPRSRVVEIATLSVLDAAGEVLYRIRPASSETSRDKVMSLVGFAFDEEVLDEKERMES